MKLHTTNMDMANSFNRLLSYYPKFSIATAWAGSGFDLSDTLIKKLGKAEKVIIGTHFYQTHPEFIRQTMHIKSVRFNLNTSGVFHPKLYIFFKDRNSWTILMGSANFTKAAFANNEELLIEICSDDSVKGVFDDTMKFIDRCWKHANEMTYEKYLDYRENWNRKIWHRAELSNVAKSETAFIDHLTDFQKLEWKHYIKKLTVQYQRVIVRLELLEYVNGLFKQNEDFGSWPIYDKLFVAGVTGSSRGGIYELWAHLGTTTRQANYRNVLGRTNSAVCSALRYIPLSGIVKKEDYMRFRKKFTEVYGDTSITSATRLLAMKRPDVFYCYTSENRDEFAQSFGIAPTTVNLANYWEKVVEGIRVSNWYNISTPQDFLEARIYSTKAALLDALFYN